VRYVDRFWACEQPAAGPLAEMLPGSGAECIFVSRQALRVSSLTSGESWPVPAAFLLCNRQHVLQLDATGPLKFVAVRFRAGQLRHFVPASFAELQDRLTPVGELWPGLTDDLGDRLAGAGDLPERARLLARFLLGRLREGADGGQPLDHLIDTLYYAPGTRIEALAADAGWSRRHFDRRFLATYGIAPKHFARIVRLQHVARRLALRPANRLLDLALDAGYFDQAHFNHDLRALTGKTPSELLAGVRGRPHFYTPPASSSSSASNSSRAATARR
jgi:AraC-like DNA-binding protein